jgi:hypothetical protein
LEKKLIFCNIILLFFISTIFSHFAIFLLYSRPCKYFFSIVILNGESVKMRDFTFSLCLLSRFGQGFGNGRTSSGERISLLFPEISRATGVLAEGTEISWLQRSFFHRLNKRWLKILVTEGKS